MLEQDEHWQLEGRRMFSLDSIASIPPADDEFPAVTAADPQAPATALPEQHRPQPVAWLAHTGRASSGWLPGAGAPTIATTSNPLYG